MIEPVLGEDRTKPSQSRLQMSWASTRPLKHLWISCQNLCRMSHVLEHNTIDKMLPDRRVSLFLPPHTPVNDVTLKSLDLSGGRIGSEGLTCLTVLPTPYSFMHPHRDRVGTRSRVRFCARKTHTRHSHTTPHINLINTYLMCLL